MFYKVLHIILSIFEDRVFILHFAIAIEQRKISAFDFFTIILWNSFNLWALRNFQNKNIFYFIRHTPKFKSLVTFLKIIDQFTPIQMYNFPKSNLSDPRLVFQEWMLLSELVWKYLKWSFIDFFPLQIQFPNPKHQACSNFNFA